MSEEIIKNIPGTGGAFPNSDGQVASGGIGGVADPGFPFVGNNTPAEAEYGLTDGPNAVNPSFTENPRYAGAGILRPEQARRFIDYVWDATTLANDGRRVTMRADRKSVV